MNRQQTLCDDIMGLKAQLAGKRLELAMLRGNRRNAQHHQSQMYAVIKARRAHQMQAAERAGECFFDAAGRADRVAMGVCVS